MPKFNAMQEDGGMLASHRRSLERKRQEAVENVDIDIYTQAASLYQTDPKEVARRADALFKSNNKQEAGLVS